MKIPFDNQALKVVEKSYETAPNERMIYYDQNAKEIYDEIPVFSQENHDWLFFIYSIGLQYFEKDHVLFDSQGNQPRIRFNCSYSFSEHLNRDFVYKLIHSGSPSGTIKWLVKSSAAEILDLDTSMQKQIDLAILKEHIEQNAFNQGINLDLEFKMEVQELIFKGIIESRFIHNGVSSDLNYEYGFELKEGRDLTLEKKQLDAKIKNLIIQVVATEAHIDLNAFYSNTSEYLANLLKQALHTFLIEQNLELVYGSYWLSESPITARSILLNLKTTSETKDHFIVEHEVQLNLKQTDLNKWFFNNKADAQKWVSEELNLILQDKIIEVNLVECIDVFNTSYVRQTVTEMAEEIGFKLRRLTVNMLDTHPIPSSFQHTRTHLMESSDERVMVQFDLDINMVINNMQGLAPLIQKNTDKDAILKRIDKAIESHLKQICLSFIPIEYELKDRAKASQEMEKELLGFLENKFGITAGTVICKSLTTNVMRAEEKLSGVYTEFNLDYGESTYACLFIIDGINKKDWFKFSKKRQHFKEDEEFIKYLSDRINTHCQEQLRKKEQPNLEEVIKVAATSVEKEFGIHLSIPEGLKVIRNHTEQLKESIRLKKLDEKVKMEQNELNFRIEMHQHSLRAKKKMLEKLFADRLANLVNLSEDNNKIDQELEELMSFSFIKSKTK